MSAGKFWILATLSLMICALVVVEIITDSQVSGLSDAILFHQAYQNREKQQQDVLRRMIQELVSASASDPAIVNFLGNHGVQLRNNAAAPAAAPAPSAPPAAPVPAAPAPTAGKTAPPEVPPVAQ